MAQSLFGAMCAAALGVLLLGCSGTGGAGTADTGTPACTCKSGCGAQERCLQNRFGGSTPRGVTCDPPTGLAQCRPTCDLTGCPAERPHCRSIMLSGGCCTDVAVAGRLCCANAEATDVGNCL
jgi:hypothetical protein